MIHQEEVQIPLMAVGMTHGILRRWIVCSGERVAIGQPIFELETDDAIFEIESFDLGIITTTGIEGQSYEVGTKIGFIEFTEEERVEVEHFGLRLTHGMRQAIEDQRGELTRNEWLREAFSEFIATKLKSEQDGTSNGG
jgi:pyruvate/2-oxoglutarate dehydrogenase complex dihydrolipoamide acyltransferase (E2) component